MLQSITNLRSADLTYSYAKHSLLLLVFQMNNGARAIVFVVILCMMSGIECGCTCLGGVTVKCVGEVNISDLQSLSCRLEGKLTTRIRYLYNVFMLSNSAMVVSRSILSDFDQ